MLMRPHRAFWWNSQKFAAFTVFLLARPPKSTPSPLKGRQRGEYLLHLPALALLNYNYKFELSMLLCFISHWHVYEHCCDDMNPLVIQDIVFRA